MAIKPSDDYNKCIQKYYTIVICEAICKVCLIKIAFKKNIYNGERRKLLIIYVVIMAIKIQYGETSVL